MHATFPSSLAAAEAAAEIAPAEKDKKRPVEDS